MAERTDGPGPACAVAHGDRPALAGRRTLVAVFAGPVARYLLRFGVELGFDPVLVEPDPQRRAAVVDPAGPVVAGLAAEFVTPAADVVVCDHHRAELGGQLRDALALPARWVGVLGNPRHEGPHVVALRELGVADRDIVRVHRPVGLNIGSRTPPEIALATLAGLVADRNGRPGGFDW